MRRWRCLQIHKQHIDGKSNNCSYWQVGKKLNVGLGCSFMLTTVLTCWQQYYLMLLVPGMVYCILYIIACELVSFAVILNVLCSGSFLFLAYAQRKAALLQMRHGQKVRPAKHDRVYQLRGRQRLERLGVGRRGGGAVDNAPAPAGNRLGFHG